MAGLALEDPAVDGCITKAPGGGECAGPSPVDLKLGMKRSLPAEGYGIRWAGCCPRRTGDKAPIQAGQRWQVERTNSWHNDFNRLQRCYERREDVVDAFFDLADTIITVRSMIRQSWTLYRWHDRPAKQP